MAEGKSDKPAIQKLLDELRVKEKGMTGIERLRAARESLDRLCIDIAATTKEEDENPIPREQDINFWRTSVRLAAARVSGSCRGLRMAARIAEIRRNARLPKGEETNVAFDNQEAGADAEKED